MPSEIVSKIIGKSEKRKKIEETARLENIKLAKAAIATSLRTDGFTIGKVLGVQYNIQKIVPLNNLEPDHILVTLKEMGEFLNEIEPTFKDWKKKGDKGIEEINWENAKEELADVLILEARATVMSGQYESNVQAQYLRNDLMDSGSYLINSTATKGQLLLASVMPFYSPTSEFSEKVSSMYYLAQFASMMPFGIVGLQEAWTKKAMKVVNREYEI